MLIGGPLRVLTTLSHFDLSKVNMGSREDWTSHTVCPRATFKPIYASPTQLGDPGGPGKGCKDFSKNEKSENLKIGKSENLKI